MTSPRYRLLGETNGRAEIYCQDDDLGEILTVALETSGVDEWAVWERGQWIKESAPLSEWTRLAWCPSRIIEGAELDRLLREHAMAAENREPYRGGAS